MGDRDTGVVGEAGWPVASHIVDPVALAAWMDGRGLGAGPLEEAVLIAGGTQNVLLLFRRAGRSYVLRRPPEHKRRNSDETMRREAQVLGALAGSDVPHPALIAACSDLGVLGAAFYLMEPVAGCNPSLGLPTAYDEPGWRHALGLSMADGIAALARIDPAAPALAGLGRPDGWLERQVDRWRSQLASYGELAGYGGPAIPGVDTVARWLDERRPATAALGLIHGDFHFANVIARTDAPRLAAIVDWELATIGDPLLDLGHLLATWPDPGNAGGAAGMVGSDGLPSHTELIDRWAAVSGRDAADTAWYRVLACYRLGIILEGSNARADAGLAPREIGDRLHAMTVGLFEQALSLIG